MTKTISAIFEQGVFRPTEPVGLADGQHVELTVRTGETAARPSSAFEVLSRLANLPVEGEADAFSGSEHDEVLYGRNGAR